jgi:hypothetical protein
MMRRLEKRDFWAAHLTAWRNSGLSQTRYCEQQGLAIANFTYWRQRLADTAPVGTTGVTFVAASVSSTPVHAGLCLRHAHWQLELPANVPAQWLADLLKALN